jgi:hypothetical protein
VRRWSGSLVEKQDPAGGTAGIWIRPGNLPAALLPSGNQRVQRPHVRLHHAVELARKNAGSPFMRDRTATVTLPPACGTRRTRPPWHAIADMADQTSRSWPSAPASGSPPSDLYSHVVQCPEGPGRSAEKDPSRIKPLTACASVHDEQALRSGIRTITRCHESPSTELFPIADYLLCGQVSSSTGRAP